MRYCRGWRRREKRGDEEQQHQQQLIPSPPSILFTHPLFSLHLSPPFPHPLYLPSHPHHRPPVLPFRYIAPLPNPDLPHSASTTKGSITINPPLPSIHPSIHPSTHPIHPCDIYPIPHFPSTSHTFPSHQIHIDKQKAYSPIGKLSYY
jgi:hypothetical protein